MRWIAISLALLGCWVHAVSGNPACVMATEPTDERLTLAQRSPDAEAKQQPATQADRNGEHAEKESADEEQRVLSFVGTHQPKLLELMKFLKQKQPGQYEQALREMSRAQVRLESLAKRDQDLYAIELELWQIRSQLRLLAAEISVAPEAKQEKLNAKLALLVEKEVAQDLARLKLQRERTAEQLQQLDQQIAQRESETAVQVEKLLKQWKNRIAQQTPKTKKPKRKE